MSTYYPHITSVQGTEFKVMQDAGRFGHVQTTNNVLTEVARFSCAEYTSLVASLTLFVTGVRLSNGDACTFTQEMGVKRLSGGNVDIIGSLPSPKASKDPSMSLADFAVSESGADLVVSVKGVGSATIDWCCQIYVNHMFGIA